LLLELEELLELELLLFELELLLELLLDVALLVAWLRACTHRRGRHWL